MTTVCFFSLLGIANAQVTLTPGADAEAFASALGKDVGTLQSELETQVNNLFQVANVHSFLRDFQNAQSFSTKGLGVDYASEGTLVEVGATLSLASNVDKAYKPSNSATDPPISGGGTNFSLMGGAGLGSLGVPVMIFGNWFKGGASIGALSGDYQNWGMHGQLRLFGPSNSMSLTKVLIRWGGIALTTGVDYSKTSLHYGKAINSSFNVASNAPVTVKSDVIGNMRFNLEQTTWAVPLDTTPPLVMVKLALAPVLPTRMSMKALLVASTAELLTTTTPLVSMTSC